MKILVGPLQAQNANLVGNEFVAGLPSPAAALGFGGALLRKCGVETWDQKVLFVLHSADIGSGRQRAHPKVENGALKNIEIKEDLKGVVRFSLLIEAPEPTLLEALKSALPRMRFAGGVLQDTIVSGRSLRPLSERLTLLDPDASFSELQLPRGYALIPPQQTDANIVTFGDHAGLARIRDRAYTASPESGYIVPTAVGYRLLEDPESAAPRTGGRGNYPHVYSEPALGLAEFLSVRNRAFDVPLSTLNPFMWRWAASFTNRFVMFSPIHLDALINGAHG